MRFRSLRRNLRFLLFEVFFFVVGGLSRFYAASAFPRQILHPRHLQGKSLELPGAVVQKDAESISAVSKSSVPNSPMVSKRHGTAVSNRSIAFEEAVSPRTPPVSSRNSNSAEDGHLQSCFSDRSDAPSRLRSREKVRLMTSPTPDDTVELQLVWQMDRASANKSISARRLSVGSAATFTLIKVVTEKTEKRRCSTFLNSLVMNPGSNKRVAFEVFGLLLILYDLVWWPAQVFGFDSNPFTGAMLWLSSAFWACDLLLSFFVGFTIIDQGLIEMRVSKIARHYARTWLPIDLSLVLLDWTLNALILLNRYGVADLGGGAFLEKVQVLRLLRLLRLFKASGFISALADRIQSETTRILLRVLKLLVFIMLINHLIACSWYGLGRLEGEDREDTWVSANDVKEKGKLYAYTTALHWSITQFTPASMEVVPKNELERSFTILVILSAMVIFSSFISTITNAMNQLRNLNSERNAELVKLRRFFSENKVSASIVARISSCIHQSTKLTSSRVHSEDISILELLPVSLKCDLAEEVYAPTLCAHPLILCWAEYYPRESKRLFVAAKSFSLGAKHELFHAGQVTGNMYFLSSGQMVFMRDDAGGPPALVSPGQWLAEPAMWIKWKHVGLASSSRNCELVSLPCEAAMKILSHSNASTYSGARRYAKCFAAYFIKHTDKLSDVWADMDVIEAMVSTAFIKEERLGCS
ncbi:unnamed protein product [Polarella glacialis]|uniref:Ion transport domain-containing protein n=1 Tax=Polarella glacialis TaxID=89957 RepID=A0A813GWP6_POLGL|nr:unnamed protein product [Polarella glacialis]